MVIILALIVIVVIWAILKAGKGNTAQSTAPQTAQRQTKPKTASVRRVPKVKEEESEADLNRHLYGKLKDLSIGLFGDEPNHDELMKLFEKKKYDVLWDKFLTMHQDTAGKIADNRDEASIKELSKAYCYRKSYISCLLMAKRDELYDLGENPYDYDVEIIPCNNDSDDRCSIKKGMVVPFVEFYNKPNIPCSEKCLCGWVYDCNIDINRRDIRQEVNEY